MIFRIRARIAVLIRRVKARLLGGQVLPHHNYSNSKATAWSIRLLDMLFFVVSPFVFSDVISTWQHVVTIQSSDEGHVICTGRECLHGWEVTLSRTGYPSVTRILLPPAPSIQDALLEGYEETRLALQELNIQGSSPD